MKVQAGVLSAAVLYFLLQAGIAKQQHLPKVGVRDALKPY